MYIPKYYRLDDREHISALLTAHPFGILVAYDGQKLVATHMPFEWQEIGEQLKLLGHVARGNTIWRVAPQMADAMVIFQGPHTYISSSWYQDPNVPTWNYQAIHVYGTVRVIEDQEFHEAMQHMLNRYESGRPEGRTWESLEPSFREQQMRGIVGLAMDVVRIEAAQKMSQNRQDEDFHHIVDKLEGSSLAQDHEVARVMKSVRPQLFSEESS